MEWGAWAAICFGLIATGIAVVSVPRNPHFALARVCFALAGLSAMLQLVSWGVQTDMALPVRLLLAGGGSALAAVLAVELIRWVNDADRARGRPVAAEEEVPTVEAPSLREQQPQNKSPALAPDRAKLLAFGREGEELKRRWSTEDSDDLFSATEDWGNRVLAYLNGLGEETRGDLFASDLGFQPTQYASQRARPSLASNWLERRLFQLDRLVNQVPTVTAAAVPDTRTSGASLPLASPAGRQPEATGNTEKIAGVIALIKEGRAIQATFEQSNDGPGIQAAYREWVPKVRAFIVANLDESYAVQFDQARGDGRVLVGRNAEGGTYWSAINGKNRFLSDLITELRARPST
jgi:hypothetical protein